jgi:hypothetical protein
MAHGLRTPAKLLIESGLDKDYEVIKYETSNPGQWFVRVTHTPSAVKAHGNKDRKRAG